MRKTLRIRWDYDILSLSYAIQNPHPNREWRYDRRMTLYPPAYHHDGLVRYCLWCIQGTRAQPRSLDSTYLRLTYSGYRYRHRTHQNCWDDFSPCSSEFLPSLTQLETAHVVYRYRWILWYGSRLREHSFSESRRSLKCDSRIKNEWWSEQ